MVWTWHSRHYEYTGLAFFVHVLLYMGASAAEFGPIFFNEIGHIEQNV